RGFGPGGRCPVRRLPARFPFASIPVPVLGTPPRLAAAALTFLLAGCGGGGGGSSGSDAPFTALPPDGGPGTSTGNFGPAPVPTPDYQPVWNEDAFGLGRTALFGSFPSDVVRFGTTVFTTDADQIEGAGATIVPVETGGASPQASTRYAPVVI